MAKKNDKMKPYSTMKLLGVLGKEAVKGVTKTGLVGQAASKLSTINRRKKEYSSGVR